MKKIFRLEYVSQEQLKEDFPTDVSCSRMLKDSTSSLKSITIQLPDYCLSDKSRNYNLVILTDEELKGLEGKTK